VLVDLQEREGNLGGLILDPLEPIALNERFGPPRISSTAGRIRSSLVGCRRVVPAGAGSRSYFSPTSTGSRLEYGSSFQFPRTSATGARKLERTISVSFN